MAYAAYPRHVQPYAREKAPRSDIKMLLGMCVVAMVALGAIVSLGMLDKSGFNIGKFFTPVEGQEEAQTFSLSNIKLGTTMDDLLVLHPRARQGVSSDGAVTMTFQDKGMPTAVWYGNYKGQRVAYKMRQASVVSGVSEDEYIGQIVERYGAPSLASCSRRVSDGMRDCQFSWWIPGELRLDINSRQDMYASAQSGSLLKITTQVTETRLAGHMRRSRI